jgi:hypothetical protein
MQLQGMGSVAQDSSVGGERSGSAGFASCLVKEMTTQVGCKVAVSGWSRGRGGIRRMRVPCVSTQT